jgi:hypothetical protein
VAAEAQQRDGVVDGASLFGSARELIRTVEARQQGGGGNVAATVGAWAPLFRWLLLLLLVYKHWRAAGAAGVGGFLAEGRRVLV